MADLPQHREINVNDPASSKPATRQSWARYVIACVVAVVVLAVVVLHLTGVVTPGAH